MNFIVSKLCQNNDFNSFITKFFCLKHIKKYIDSIKKSNFDDIIKKNIRIKVIFLLYNMCLEQI